MFTPEFQNPRQSNLGELLRQQGVQVTSRYSDEVEKQRQRAYDATGWQIASPSIGLPYDALLRVEALKIAHIDRAPTATASDVIGLATAYLKFLQGG